MSVAAGVDEESCEISNVGLWVDALTFCVVTLQIILFNTRYTETIKEDIINKERVAEQLVPLRRVANTDDMTCPLLLSVL